MLIRAMLRVGALPLAGMLPLTVAAQSGPSRPTATVVFGVPLLPGRLRVERYQGALAVSERMRGPDILEALVQRDTNPAVLAFRRAMTPAPANPALVTGAPVVTICPMPIAQRAAGVTDRMPVLRGDSLVDGIEARSAITRRCVNPLGQPPVR